QAGGRGPRDAQRNVCWAEDEAEARRTGRQVWPNGGIPGQLAQDLPTWSHFEDVAAMLTEDQAVGSVPCGPDADAVVESVERHVDAGYDHLYFHPVGPDQEGFFRFWDDALRDRVAALADSAPARRSA